MSRCILIILSFLLISLHTVKAQNDASYQKVVSKFALEIDELISANKCDEAIDEIFLKYYSEDELESSVGRVVAALSGFALSVLHGKDNVSKDIDCKIPIDIRLPALMETYQVLYNVDNNTPQRQKNVLSVILERQLNQILGDKWLLKASLTGVQPFILEAAFQNLICDNHSKNRNNTLLEFIFSDENSSKDIIKRFFENDSGCLIKNSDLNMSVEACFWLAVTKLHQNEDSYLSGASGLSRFQKVAVVSGIEEYQYSLNEVNDELATQDISIISSEANKMYLEMNVNFVSSYCKPYLGADAYNVLQDKAKNIKFISIDDFISDAAGN